MPSIKIQSPNGLINTVIQQKQEVYYLLTSDNISAIKSRSIWNDVFIFLAPLCWGAYLSIYGTLISIPNPDDIKNPITAVLIKLNAYSTFTIIGGVIFTIFSIVSFYQSYKEIKSYKTDSKDIDLTKDSVMLNATQI